MSSQPILANVGVSESPKLGASSRVSIVFAKDCAETSTRTKGVARRASEGFYGPELRTALSRVAMPFLLRAVVSRDPPAVSRDAFGKTARLLSRELQRRLSRRDIPEYFWAVGTLKDCNFVFQSSVRRLSFSDN